MIFSSVTYDDLLPVDSQEICPGCNCCSKCQAACSCGASGENEDNVIMRILGIDPSSEVMQKAEQFRKRFVEEEEEMMKEDSDIEEEDQVGDDDEEERDGDEEDNEVVGVISI